MQHSWELHNINCIEGTVACDKTWQWTLDIMKQWFRVSHCPISPSFLACMSKSVVCCTALCGFWVARELFKPCQTGLIILLENTMAAYLIHLRANNAFVWQIVTMLHAICQCCAFANVAKPIHKQKFKLLKATASQMVECTCVRAEDDIFVCVGTTQVKRSEHLDMHIELIQLILQQLN